MSYGQHNGFVPPHLQPSFGANRYPNGQQFDSFGAPLPQRYPTQQQQQQQQQVQTRGYDPYGAASAQYVAPYNPYSMANQQLAQYQQQYGQYGQQQQQQPKPIKQVINNPYNQPSALSQATADSKKKLAGSVSTSSSAYGNFKMAPPGASSSSSSSAPAGVSKPSVYQAAAQQVLGSSSSSASLNSSMPFNSSVSSVYAGGGGGGGGSNYDNFDIGSSNGGSSGGYSSGYSSGYTEQKVALPQLKPSTNGPSASSSSSSSSSAPRPNPSAPKPNVVVTNSANLANLANSQKSGEGVKRAVLIGINYKGTKAALTGCINDVKDVASTLAKIGFEAKEDTNIRILTEESRRQPTRANILDSMKWLTAGAQPGDVLWFHFSGHGAQQRQATAAGHVREADGMDESIIPLDYQKAGTIIDDEIQDALVDPLPEGCTLYVVMDCCHSGTILDLRYIYEEGSRRFVADDEIKDSKGTVYMISGCMNVQTSADLPPGFQKGLAQSVGALTGSLMPLIPQGLTWHKLITELRKGMKSSGLTQVPQFEVSKGTVSLEEPAFHHAAGMSHVTVGVGAGQPHEEVPENERNQAALKVAKFQKLRNKMLDDPYFRPIVASMRIVAIKNPDQKKVFLGFREMLHTNIKASANALKRLIAAFLSKLEVDYPSLFFQYDECRRIIAEDPTSLNNPTRFGISLDQAVAEGLVDPSLAAAVAASRGLARHGQLQIQPYYPGAQQNGSRIHNSASMPSLRPPGSEFQQQPQSPPQLYQQRVQRAGTKAPQRRV